MNSFRKLSGLAGPGHVLNCLGRFLVSPFANHTPGAWNRSVDIGAVRPPVPGSFCKARSHVLIGAFPRAECLGPRPLAPRTRGNLKRFRKRTPRRSARAIRAGFWIAGQNCYKRSPPPVATPGRGTSLLSNRLWPMPIRPWPNGFAPVSQNECGWPAAGTSWKTGIKFACPSRKGRAKPFRPANSAIAKGSDDEEDQG